MREPAGGRGGFTILELALLVLAVTALALAGLLPLVRRRCDANDAAAVELLRMVSSAQREWTAATGRRAALWEMAVSLPGVSEGARDRRSLLPPGLFPAEGGHGRSGGHLFRDGLGPDGRPGGCWAWPALPGYSGGRAFWLDYGSGRVHPARARAVRGAAPPDRLPAAGDLEPPLP